MLHPDDKCEPIFLKHISRRDFPPILTAALLILFNPHDVVTYYPFELNEGENVIFHVLNMAEGSLHRFDFAQSDFIFQVDPTSEDLQDVLDFLMQIEERLSGDDLLERLDFVENRSLSKREYPYLLKYYNYLRGTEKYDMTDEEEDADD